MFDLFRKGLSTLVETTLEGADNSPLSNYFNNTKQLWKTYKNKEQFYQEGVEAVGAKGEIEKMKEEMFSWYTQEAEITYPPALVRPVIDGVTDMTVACVIRFGLMIDAIEEHKKLAKTPNAL